jgi:hypothetical protein
MLPSEYADKYLNAPRQDWTGRIRQSLQTHKKVVEPRVLQEGLVRELLLNPRLLAPLLYDRVPRNAWTGESLLVTLKDGQGTTAGLVFVENQPTSVSLTVPPELKFKLPQDNLQTLERITALLVRGTDIHLDEGEFLIPEKEELEIIPIPLVLARKPKLEFTAAMGDALNGPDKTVTVGIPARDAEQRTTGFVTVEHGLGDAKSNSTYNFPNGMKCRVLKRSHNWDAAFVACQEPISSSLRLTSVLKKHAPGRGMVVTFLGSQSGKKSATIDGVDPILPHYSPNEPNGIARVYTNRCTVPGDSGAALVTDDGVIIGLSSMRTHEDEDLQYSVWMWMAGVLDSLNVEFISSP